MHHSKKTRIYPIDNTTKTPQFSSELKANDPISSDKGIPSKKQYIIGSILCGIVITGLFAVVVVVPLMHSLNASKSETTTMLYNITTSNTNSLPTVSTTSTVAVTTTTNYLVCTWSSTWSNGPCSVTCGMGSYVRQRYCYDQFNTNCISCTPNNATVGTRPCYYPQCGG